MNNQVGDTGSGELQVICINLSGTSTMISAIFFFEVNLVGTQEKYMGTDKVAFAVDRTIAHDRK
jgi:hypothetical protein